VRSAFVNVDLDFFTKPYYIGNHYEEEEWKSTSNFKARASKWMHTEEFISRLPMISKRIRGSFVKQDQQMLFSLSNLIQTDFLKPKMFDLINFDAHHDMYMWNDSDYFNNKSGLSDYAPFESMIAPFKMEWINNLIWVHPDYVIPKLPDIKALYPNAKITAIQWSDWNWNEHEMKYLSIVTNPDMSIINQGMLEDFERIVQVW